MAAYSPQPGELPPEIPLFPLEGALLLPRAWLPLHIFEPRYVAMLDAALATQERLIGMIQPEGKGLARVGCAGRISAFAETPKGTYTITLNGICRFRLAEVSDLKNLWMTGSVDWQDYTQDLADVPQDTSFDRDAFLDLLARFGRAQGRIIADEGLADLAEEALINEVAMSAGFSPGDKQGLLEAPGLGERRALLVSLMQFALYGDPKESRTQ